MRCERARKLLSDQLDGALPASARARLEAHIGACQACRAYGEALVRLQAGQEATPEEIIEWCRGKMADYRIPRSVEFVADFPRTAAGKVQKSVLRKQYWEGAERKI